MSRNATPAFTLAELLISLAILGEIATFTIPKILSSQQSQANLAKTKEAVGIMSEAYQQYKAANGYVAPTNTRCDALKAYINYVKQDTISVVDLRPNWSGGVDCSNSYWTCLKLHNGGMLVLTAESFGGNTSTNAVNFGFDADSTYSGSTATNTPGQGVEFWLYYNGKLRTSGTMENPSSRSGSNVYVGPGNDPSWFSW